jgi:hypothetical protein
MDDKLSAKLMARLPKTKLADPGKLELHFLTGTVDLEKFARDNKPATPPGFSDAEKILQFVRKFSNFPNMLKKKKELAALFTAPAREHATIALLSTPYLGLDTAARDYFLPVEFRTYWALMIGVGAGELDKLAKKIAAKKLIKNGEEFKETLARIR